MVMVLLLCAVLQVNTVAAQTPARQDSAPTSSGSLVSTGISLGSAIINSVATFDDPYAEFRGAHYSNDGVLSERDEIELGRKLHAQVQKKFQVVAAGQDRVSRIGQRVARASLRPNLAYHFFVIHDSSINAFSTPGGYIYVTDALVNLANNDELAAVLSHEVGHVVARHSLQTLQESSALSGLASLFGSITGLAGDTAGELGTAAAQIVASGLLSVHNREQEREADFLGVRALPKAGFDPAGMVTMFRKLERVEQSNPGLLGSLFSDHPDAGERISNTEYEINRMRDSSPQQRRRLKTE